MDPALDRGNFRDLARILEGSGVFFWLDQGTLLGAVREGGPIPWDRDIDLSVWKEDFAVVRDLKPVFEGAGFYFECHDHKDCIFLNRGRGRFIEIASQRRNGDFVLRDNAQPRDRRLEKVIKWTTSPLPEGVFFRIRHLGRKWFPRPIVVFQTPAEYFSEFRTMRFLECQAWVPARVEEYLTFKYGPDWRKPKTEWNYMTDDGAVRGSDR